MKVAREFPLFWITPLFLALTLALTACGDDDDDDDNSIVVDAKGLTPSSFSASGTTPMSSDEVIDEMDDFDAHENKAEQDIMAALTSHKPSGMALTKGMGLTQIGGDFVSCVIDDDDVIRAEGDTWSWDLESGDFGTCLADTFDGFMKNIAVDISAAFFMSQSCPGADYSAIDGVSLSEFFESDDISSVMAAFEGVKPCDLKTNSMTYETKMAIGGTISGDIETEEGTQRLQMKMIMKSAMIASDGGGCKFKTSEGKVTVEDCVHYSSSETSATTDTRSNVTKNYTKAVSTGVKGSIDNEYLASGEVDIRINDWTGTVTLDGSANPSYQLKNGTKVIGGQVGRASSSPPRNVPIDERPRPIEDRPEIDRDTEIEPVSEPDPYELPELGLSSDAEVHFIGIYEGDSDVTQVSVDRPAKPIVLVLTAYDATEFQVDIAEGTTVELIILSGYHSSSVTGVDDTIKVITSSYDDDVYAGDGQLLRAEFPYFYAYKDDSEPQFDIDFIAGEWRCIDEPARFFENKWGSSLEVIERITGKSPESAQGTYAGTTFTLDAATSSSLEAQRESGNCYKDPDGSLVRHNF